MQGSLNMSGKTTISRDSTPLTCGDAVAAILVLDDGRYLLQHRDDIPGIWYPDHWGCFGGAIDPGEEPQETMSRELREELAIELQPIGPILKMDYEIVGRGKFYRNYFVSKISLEQVSAIRLGEGQDFGLFAGSEVLDTLRMTPYDAFAHYLHMSGQRITVAPPTDER